MLRISFSRKGFDSGCKKTTSPILPDGRLISLPIPQEDGLCSFSELKVDDKLSFEKLFTDLEYGSLIDQRCHLDPDIYPNAIKRFPGWKPTLGHAKEQNQLVKQGFSKGDIFLFFGRFRKTNLNKNGNIIWDITEKKDRHIIWGYLQVDQIIPVMLDTVCPQWLEGHPHTSKIHRKKKHNTIYISSDRLTFDETLPGAGVFRYSQDLVLTKDGCSLSRWDRGKMDFMKTYRIYKHSDDDWKSEYFQSRYRGQEIIVTPATEDSKLSEWVLNLIRKNLDRD